MVIGPRNTQCAKCGRPMPPSYSIYCNTCSKIVNPRPVPPSNDPTEPYVASTTETTSHTVSMLLGENQALKNEMRAIKKHLAEVYEDVIQMAAHIKALTIEPEV